MNVRKKLWISVFIFSFILLVGCSEVKEVKDMYTASTLSDQIQKIMDQADSIAKKDQIEVDKILAADSNTTDKKKMEQALADFDRLDTKIIPAYEKILNQAKADLQKLQGSVTKINAKEVKALGDSTINSYLKMIDAELAYIAQAKKSSALQRDFFTTLQKGNEPTNAQIDSYNQDIVQYNKVFDSLNASIDSFNADWQKLVQKAGAELQQ